MNPAESGEPGRRTGATRSRPATLAELEAMVEAMPPRYRLMMLLAAWCALRFGELTELRRGDVDTTSGVMQVRRAVVLRRGRVRRKDARSRRPGGGT